MSEEVKLRGSTKRRGSTKTPKVTHHNIRCVVLGDGGVGKTAMLITFLTGRYSSEVPPGIIDGLSEYDHLSSHPVKMAESNVEVDLTLVDSYGLDEYEKLREKVCSSADIYMLCFDTSNVSSFERIRDHWVPEMRSYSAAQTPFILVGLKIDLRLKAQAGGDDIANFVTPSQGMKEATELGASQYTESSAKNNTNVRRVFQKAVEAALQSSLAADNQRNSCVVS